MDEQLAEMGSNPCMSNCISGKKKSKIANLNNVMETETKYSNTQKHNCVRSFSTFDREGGEV
jgi:hypothetical protein